MVGPQKDYVHVLHAKMLEALVMSSSLIRSVQPVIPNPPRIGRVGSLSDDGSPYRGTAIATEELINNQMIQTCALLKTFARWKPVIAGGALWSWAQGDPANDIDVFCKKTWRTSRLATQHFGLQLSGVLQGQVKVIRYGGSTKAEGYVPITRHKSVLPMLDTPVDFNLTKWTGAEVVEHFDYRHDMICWGWRISCTHGATYYTKKELSRCYERGRDEETVKSKIKKRLWGNDKTGEHLRRVMMTLSHMYPRAVSW